MVKIEAAPEVENISNATLPSAQALLPIVKEPALFLIDGKLKRWEGRVDAVRPLILGERGKDQTLGFQPMLDQEAALQAVASSNQAWDSGLGGWPNASAQERIAATEKFIDELEKRKDHIVELLMWEIGKSEGRAIREFDRTISFIKEAIIKYQDFENQWEISNTRQGVKTSQGLMPLGRILCMGPSNYPVNESLTTAIPAALLGNTVILKTPRYGTLLFNPIMEALAASYPAGVINVIGGDGQEVITPIMKSGDIDGLAFIGSERAASAILASHPRRDLIPKLLGLSAKNSAIVLEDADIDQAVETCLHGAFDDNGQRCTALKRIFVARAIAKQFAEKLARAVEGLQLGMPWEPQADQTPLYEANKAEWLDTLVQDSQTKGAEIMNVGGASTNGALYTPAVLFPVSMDMEIANVEQFGPLAPIIPFDSIEDVLRIIAQTPYGQQISLFSKGAEGQECADLHRKLLLTGGSRLNLKMQAMRGPDNVTFGGRRNAGVGYVSIEDSLTTFAIRSVIAEAA